ncbi:MAG TPA: LLM class flavin-dependent oxidoreductase [Candidatus Binataceae bacterium]|jgi:alkanesulfonate monooxygenase SsuD/methylene tetrahydromethanopterin reductase-like flavin-dependent oxidoreductase (luciferase family)|nr:LLM class flavin-dependent oxidoreductase [Candidatus Binataceae bacterium]
MRTIKFGMHIFNGDFERARRSTLLAEELGYHLISFDDHLLPAKTPGARIPQFECYTMLAWMASITRRVRLVPTVGCMSFRNPALLAKMFTTLDYISGGRITVGVGAGWLRSEYEAYGFPYPSTGERIAQLGEGVKVMKAMWTQLEPSFSGRYFHVEKAVNLPPPLQKPHPPIMVGGTDLRTLRIIAQDANMMSFFTHTLTVAELKRRLALMREMAAQAGRNADEIEISAMVKVYPAETAGESAAVAARVAREITTGNFKPQLPDAEAARNAPALLIGTVDEIKRGIRARCEELGCSSFNLILPSDEFAAIFAKRIMPEFTG